MDDKLKYILTFIPIGIADEITRCVRGQVEEIRLRRGRNAVIISGGIQTVLNSVCGNTEIAETVDRLCRGSFHSHLDTMKEGYISVPGGFRVGVCGRAVTQNGEISNICDITSINIRIPNRIPGSASSFVEYLARNSFRTGVLIYSPPGVGKTTLLRDTAAQLSSKPYLRRVALIDTRGELDPCESRCVTLDVYSDYPKVKGIELAVRTMSPQVLICDEIGADEAAAVISVRSSGVPLIASAHAGNIRELLSSPGIKKLHESGIFDCYVSIRRVANGFSYIYTPRSDAEKEAK